MLITFFISSLFFRFFQFFFYFSVHPFFVLYDILLPCTFLHFFKDWQNCHTNSLPSVKFKPFILSKLHTFLVDTDFKITPDASKKNWTHNSDFKQRFEMSFIEENRESNLNILNNEAVEARDVFEQVQKIQSIYFHISLSKGKWEVDCC